MNKYVLFDNIVGALHIYLVGICKQKCERLKLILECYVTMCRPLALQSNCYNASIYAKSGNLARKGSFLEILCSTNVQKKRNT